MYEISIDVGGTFTDFVVRDSLGKVIHTKVPSNPQNPLNPILQGLSDISRAFDLSIDELLKNTDKFTHGTTLGINALLQGHGAKTALLTTEGFRDALELRRSRLANQWDFAAPLPPILVPRYLRLGIRERLDYRGAVLTPVDHTQIAQIANFLIDEDIEAIAVCFLFACQNSAHEREVKEIIHSLLPHVFVTLSSELSPQLGEYERTVTTVLNARLSPLVNEYLDSLQALLQDHGLDVPILVSQNNGGLTDRLRAGREAVFTLFSGPAGGAKGGWALAQNAGMQNLVIADMGGTSLDISLIREGRMEMTQQAEISGYPLQIPMLDIHTLGAGGGSIAWLDVAGMLQVGPQSAGAHPGPACYGQDGDEPTITDAALIMGLLDSQDFLGGRMKLDIEKAYQVVQKKIATPLNISVEEAAYAIYRIALSRMVDAMYLMTVKKGYDPRSFTLVAAGGALPLFATALARGTGIGCVIVPDSAPVFCADGLSYARLQVELVRSVLKPLNPWTPEYALEIIHSLQSQANQELDRLGVDSLKRQYDASADLKYWDQHHTINVRMDWEDPECWNRIANDFHQTHYRFYGYSQPGNELQLVNLRLFAQEKDTEYNALATSTKSLSQRVEPNMTQPQPDAYRSVYLGGQTHLDLPVYDWNHITRGQMIEGPAILRKALTTLFLDRQSSGEIDATGNFRVTLRKVGAENDSYFGSSH